MVIPRSVSLEAQPKSVGREGHLVIVIVSSYRYMLSLTRTRARVLTTILHFLLSQPSQIDV